MKVYTKQSAENYAKTFASIWNKVTEHLQKRILHELPESYLAVDIGSADGSFAGVVKKEASSLGKKGEFRSIDPFPVNSEVLRFTGDEYINQESKDLFDLILLQFSIHFMADIRVFLEKCSEKLTDNGAIYVVVSSPNSKHPWTAPLQKAFEESSVKLNEVIPEIFSVQREQYKGIHECSRAFFIEFVQNRGYFDLRKNTEQEIQDCVEWLKQKKSDQLQIQFCAFIYKLTKKQQLKGQ